MTPKQLRKPAQDVQDRPFMVIWETTMACDLACRHCRAYAIPEDDPHTLKTEDGKQLLDQIKAFGKPYPLVVLTGGDPFKRADLVELIAYGTQLGLSLAISPSATPLLTYANLAAIREAGAKAISLSLDGSTADIHDKFRGVAGSYALTLQGWQDAQALGLKVQINTTVTKHNLHDLPAILRLIHAQGVTLWSVFFLVPTGRGLAEDEITPAAYEDVMNWLYDASKLLRIKTTEGHHYKRVILQRTILEQRGINPQAALGLGEVYQQLHTATADLLLPPRADHMRRPPMHINAGNGFVFVSKRGDVFPSGFLPLAAGNVRQTTLPDIYQHAALFHQLRQPDLLQGRCGACEFRAVCGGSRSRAYAMLNDPLGEEPFCTYEPHSFPYQADLHALLTTLA